MNDERDHGGGKRTWAKAEKLQEYVMVQEDKKVFGGIVVERNGGWKINQRPLYEWRKCNNKDWRDWVKLEF